MYDIFHIAIDGPVASGKGSVAAELSKRLGIPCLCTGALYRGFAVQCLQNNVDVHNKAVVREALSKLNMKVAVEKDGVTRIFLDKKEVTDKLYNNEVSKISSVIATIPEVRSKMVEMQQDIAKNQSFILEGRDICNVVLPNAKYKFFLTADVKTRARRRMCDLKNKGQEISFKEMIKQVKAREKNDRKNGGFKKVKGAIFIEGSNLTVTETVELMVRLSEKSAQVLH